MKKYAFWIFGAALAVLATVAALLAGRIEKHAMRGGDAIARLEHAIPEYRPEDIRKIELTAGPDETMTLVRGANGLWTLRFGGRPEAPADAFRISELLTGLASVRPLREIAIENEAELADLTLASADSGRNYGYGLKLYAADGKPVLDMMFGAPHYKAAERMGNYMIQAPDGRYVRVNRDGGKRVFLIPRVFEQVLPNPWRWLDHPKIGSFENPLMLRFSTYKKGAAKPRWEIRRTEKNQYELTCPADKILAPAKLDGKVKLLTQGFTRDVSAAGKFTPTAEFLLVFANGFAYRLTMSDSINKMECFLAMEIAFDPEKVIRLAAEDDEAFQARKSRLKQRAESEKARYGGRVYVLQPDALKIFAEIPTTDK